MGQADPSRRRPGTWDYGVDYDEMMRKIMRHYDETEDPRDVVLLVQLRNGSRISEAIEAVLEMARTGRREVYARVEKQRAERLRLMVLPEGLRLTDVERAAKYIQERYSSPRSARVSLWEYARRTYGINTHSLRYALVTKLARQGVPAQLIARITGHRKLDYILTYTQQQAAEELLRKLGG